MIFKPLKEKMRNGYVFDLNKTIEKMENNIYISLSMDWYSFGIGFSYYIGDCQRMFRADFLWLTFDLWF